MYLIDTMLYHNILYHTFSNVRMYLPILHLPREELRCKLQEKLHRVAGPLPGASENYIYVLNIVLIVQYCAPLLDRLRPLWITISEKVKNKHKTVYCIV